MSELDRLNTKLTELLTALSQVKCIRIASRIEFSLNSSFFLISSASLSTVFESSCGPDVPPTRAWPKKFPRASVISASSSSISASS